MTAAPGPVPWPAPACHPAAPWSAGPSKLTETPFDVAAVFDLKGSQTGVEQLAPGDDNHVKTRRNLVTTENLSNQAFRSISLNRATQALGGGDPQPANRQLVRQNEQSGKAAVNPGATLVDLLKFGATADVLVSPEISHRLPDRVEKPYAPSRSAGPFSARSLTADRQTLAAFRAPALEDQTPVLRAHAHQESVRPFAVARIGLERALSLHAQYFPSI